MLLLLLFSLSFGKPYSPEDSHVDLYIPADEQGACFSPPVQESLSKIRKHPEFRLLLLLFWNCHLIKSSVHRQGKQILQGARQFAHLKGSLFAGRTSRPTSTNVI